MSRQPDLSCIVLTRQTLYKVCSSVRHTLLQRKLVLSVSSHVKNLLTPLIIGRNRAWNFCPFLTVSFTSTTPPLLVSFTLTTLTVFMRFETNLLFFTEHLSPSCHEESSRSSLPLHLRATSSRRFLPPDPFPSHHGTLWKLWNDKIYVLYIVSKSDALQYIYLSYLSSKPDLCLVIYIWDQYVIVHKRIYKIYQFCTRNSKLCAWNSQSNRRKKLRLIGI